MSRFFAFDPVSHRRTLQFVDELPLINLATDQVLCVPGGRLTSSATNPLADGFNFSTLRYLPYVHNLVPLWNSSLNQWIYREISSVTAVSISNLTTNRISDVCLYVDAADGVVKWATRAWSTNTSREVALEESGIYYLNLGSGNLARATYLGSVYMTGTANNARCNDNSAQRFLWNAYHPAKQILARLLPASSWTYSSSTLRNMNGSTANRVEVIDGIGAEVLDLTFNVRASMGAGVYGQFGLGIDSTSQALGLITAGGATAGIDTTVTQTVSLQPGLGYHYAQMLELAAVGTITVYGSSLYTGVQGQWRC